MLSPSTMAVKIVADVIYSSENVRVIFAMTEIWKNILSLPQPQLGLGSLLCSLGCSISKPHVVVLVLFNPRGTAISSCSTGP